MNLGQLFAHMPGTEPSLVMFFNGRWGTYNGPEADPPDPPPFQFYPASPLFVGYVDSSAPATNSVKGAGSAYFPYKSLADAKSAVEQTITEISPFNSCARILLKSGSYPGVAGGYSFTNAMTLESRDGATVTIGQ
jgi:hypothetical protein